MGSQLGFKSLDPHSNEVQIMTKEEKITTGKVLQFKLVREAIRHMVECGLPKNDLPFARSSLAANDQFMAYSHSKKDWFRNPAPHTIIVFQIRKRKDGFYYTRITTGKNVEHCFLPGWDNWNYGEKNAQPA
jgi:hypothetical protein